MDLQYYGANCLLLSGKNVRVVVDDNLASIGLKSITKPDDVALFTSTAHTTDSKARLTFDGPGEYEVSGMSIIGIQARAHMDEPGTNTATMYKVITDEASYLFTGHIHPDLSDDQLEAIGAVDIMVVPVGGNGYTLDAGGALQLIKKIEPSVAVPTHYSDAAIQYPVEQQGLEQVLKNIGTDPKDTLAKLRYKRGEASNTTQLIILTRS